MVTGRAFDNQYFAVSTILNQSGLQAGLEVIMKDTFIASSSHYEQDLANCYNKWFKKLYTVHC